MIPLELALLISLSSPLSPPSVIKFELIVIYTKRKKKIEIIENFNNVKGLFISAVFNCKNFISVEIL